ncbi:uncharacterized protein LOC127283849 [Leptopilina boulardi]|uniref:uncharacterized protein LOC127283849 n=1 Tax=Leptopilina boulardi TaxID=63433 RepID=UPI0021F63B21|nr:uncharacterized protein LOC127283849 [Leptopilina boulardi]
MDLIPAFQVSLTWMRIVNLYLQQKDEEDHWRRYWIKPHLYPQIRNVYGASSVLFSYVKNQDHEEFYDIYRMKEHQFDELHEVLRLRLKKQYLCREPLSTELRLAITLHYLAQGDSTKTLARYYLIGRSTLYEIIAEVTKAIWDTLSKVHLKVKSNDDWKTIAENYEKRWNFPHCVGALDGKHIRIIKPPYSGSVFYNYKKFFSFVLMAMCDSNYKFTWVDVGDYGSLSDSSVFSATGFAQELESGRYRFPTGKSLPGTNKVIPYYIIGDAGFGLKPYLMRPYSQKFIKSHREENFNFRMSIINCTLSSARMTIEISFGILTSRWRILLGMLSLKLETSITIVQCLICLHNFLISNEDYEDDESKLYASAKLINRLL